MLDGIDAGYKQQLTGTHRTRSPRETLECVLPLRHQFGITRVANVTGLDRIGIPIVLATRPNSRSVAVSQGKGTSLEAAKASAVMEAIELWHAENIVRPMVFAASHEIARFGTALDIMRLPQVADSRYAAERRFHWTEGFDILSGKRLLVPHEMVHADYTHPGRPGEGCFPASTNGLASGNHPLEAICHGIYEVIERDALTVWHHMPAGRRDATGLDPGSIDCDICLALIAAIERAGLRVSIWDVTSDVGVATFLCLIVDGDNPDSHLGLGSGTHPVRDIALARALIEAAQTRMNYITGSRDDLQFAEFTSAGRTKARGAAKTLLRGGPASRSFRSVPSTTKATLREDLDWVTARLAAVSVSEVACVDLSQGMADISVVRIVIPGLEAPHDDDSFVAGPRAAAALRGAP
jgi:YcaO-like protein with predicted kinase domain